MYKNKITLDDDSGMLEKLFHAEDKSLGRSSYSVKKNGKKLTIEVTADDAVAFKTAVNTIAKVLLVWEKSASI